MTHPELIGTVAGLVLLMLANAFRRRPLTEEHPCQ